MALHENHLAGWIALHAPPHWRCARCGGGPLRFNPKEFAFRDTAETKAGRGELWFEAEMIVERFAGFIQCPNPACADWVLVSGTTRNFLEPDPEPGQYGEVLVRELWPTQVLPAPAIIDIPQQCPEDVAAAIRRAFDLYWTDSSAAANAIRVAIEALMSHFRVPKYGKGAKGKGRVAISLHKRIDEAFRKLRPDAADFLLAIKWIGNAGSHDAGELSKGALTDAFVLLDHALQELFVHPAHAKRVHRIAKAVNRAKKPRVKRSGAKRNR